MKFEYFVAQRLVKSKEKNYVKPIVRIAVISIALSITVMLVSLSVLQGFKNEIKNKIAGFGSHIQIVQYGGNALEGNNTVKLSQKEISSIKNISQIKSLSGVYVRSGAIINNDDFLGVIIKGVGKDYNKDFFKNNLSEGKIIQHGKERNQDILVSKTIADKLHLKVGDKVKVYFYVNNSYRAKKFSVCGIYDTGLAEYDERFMICDIDVLHNVFSAEENDYTSYEIMLKNFALLNPISEQIYYSTDSDKTIISITDFEPNLFAWLNLLDNNVIMIIVIMMLICIVTLSSVVLIMIFEKKTMIGILKSLGANNVAIIKIFIYRIGYIAAKGILYGNVLAISLLAIQKYTHIISLDKESYYLSYAPVSINIWYFIITDILTLVICLLCLTIPTRSISKISLSQTIKKN